MDVELGTWKMYFDRAVNQYGNGIRILLITSEGSHIPLEIKLNFEATNNMAEYKACIAGMETLQELGAKEAEVFRDSTLVIAAKVVKGEEGTFKALSTILRGLDQDL